MSDGTNPDFESLSTRLPIIISVADELSSDAWLQSPSDAFGKDGAFSGSRKNDGLFCILVAPTLGQGELVLGGSEMSSEFWQIEISYFFSKFDFCGDFLGSVHIRELCLASASRITFLFEVIFRIRPSRPNIGSRSIWPTLLRVKPMLIA